MIIPEVSVGNYELEMKFTDWDQPLVVFTMAEHIVKAIHETFNANLLANEDYRNIKTVTLTNIEVTRANNVKQGDLFG